ncbi:DUF4403 family protein [Gemmatimonas aurantiaca]|uniref:DUF4403 family protein n=1 Tax=Gemmatimonas aurantiaca TaxID=173480 RepID=UPI00145E715F|nr:DUF4403 family protein [Gemmatimonas aurantiaca]
MSKRTARMLGMTLWLLALPALYGCGSDALTPDQPKSRPGTRIIPTLPTLDASVVDAPVRYALEPLITELEKAVPRTFGDRDKRIPAGSDRKLIAFEATRTPFTVGVENGKVVLEAVVSYQARAWYRPFIGPTLSAGCGEPKDTNKDGKAGTNEGRPRVKVVLHSDVSLTPEWKLAARTRVVSVKPLTTTERDICRVTFAGIDVTDHVVKAVMPQINSRMPRVDRKMATIDVRTRVTKWFTAMQRNIRVTDSLWLQLKPELIRLGKLSIEDSMLVADVRLWAHPRMITGPEPQQMIVPLPRLTPALSQIGDSARLFIEGLLDYADASALMQKQLGSKRFYRFGRVVAIDSVRLYPLDDGRVVLAVQVGGGVRGTAYLVGTPTIDHTRRALVVADLDFDVATSDALVAGLAWLKKGDLLERLRASAEFPLDDALELTRNRVEGALNRDLTEGVRLSGTVTTGRLIDVLVHPRWLVIRAEAAGKLALDIDRPIRRGVGAGPSRR